MAGAVRRGGLKEGNGRGVVFLDYTPCRYRFK